MAQNYGMGGGQGQYPVSNEEYDCIAILHNKLQALEAYQKYLKDAKDSTLTQLIRECQQTDFQLAQRLHQELHTIGHGGQQGQMGGQQRAVGAMGGQQGQMGGQQGQQRRG